MGDPAGVGPELAFQMLRDSDLAEFCRLLVFGDAAILKKYAIEVEQDQLETSCVEPSEIPTALKHEGHAVVDLPGLELDSFKPGQVSADCGRAAFRYVQGAIDAALAGHVQAVTTGPLNKEALNLAGINFPGHTEIFAQRANAERWCMMQYSEAITCTFVTVHVGYHEVPALLTRQRVLDTIELTVEALRRIRRKEPKILVCGLNPHAGENGLFGQGEEDEAIEPAVADARAKGFDVTGPLPPDTVFLPKNRETADAFVCMYHDQGHIPVKALAFDSAVNTTLGLGNLVRTSVDHGTAFDIAWQRKADSSSLRAALKLACQLAQSPTTRDA